MAFYFGKEEPIEDEVTLTRLGRFLSIWDPVTGIPQNEPPMKYNYKIGDYYVMARPSEVSTTYVIPSGLCYDPADHPSNYRPVHTVFTGGEIYVFTGAGFYRKPAKY